MNLKVCNFLLLLLLLYYHPWKLVFVVESLHSLCFVCRVYKKKRRWVFFKALVIASFCCCCRDMGDLCFFGDFVRKS